MQNRNWSYARCKPSVIDEINFGVSVQEFETKVAKHSINFYRFFPLFLRFSPMHFRAKIFILLNLYVMQHNMYCYFYIRFCP